MYTFENKRNLLKEYQIPIPKEKQEYWSQEETMNIVFRLKEISKNITSANDMNTIMILLEIIAGKRNLNKLYYLIYVEKKHEWNRYFINCGSCYEVYF